MTLRGLIEMTDRIAAMRGRVEIGVPASASQDGTSLAMIAAVHEFGSADGRIPERSFLRPGINDNLERFRRLNFENLKRVAAGGMSLTNALGRLGEAGAAAVKLQITNGSYVSLKPATIKRKRSSKPLIDSGQLRQSITYRIAKGGA